MSVLLDMVCEPVKVTSPLLAVAFASAAGKPIDSHSPDVTWSEPAECA